MTKLYARPYNEDIPGFFFSSADEFQRRMNCWKDSLGTLVEEVEIQY